MSLALISTNRFAGLDSQVVPESLASAASNEFSAHQLIAALLGSSLATLTEAQKQALKQDMGESSILELVALASETDPLLFGQWIVQLGARLEEKDKFDWAIRFYSLAENIAMAAGALREAPLQDISKNAQQRLDAIFGKGAFGPRAEFLLKRFSKEATSPATILPMLASSVVAGFVKTAALSRFAAGAEAWYSRGFGARAISGLLAYGAEVPVFALSGRALRHFGEKTQDIRDTHDLASAAITLGLLKTFHFACHTAFQKIHRVNEVGAISRLPSLAKFSQAAMNQGAMFSGLLTAHQLEARWGLRTHVDGATTLVDTLASMLSMSVGAHLGHKVLGRKFVDWNRELALRNQAPEQTLKLSREISVFLQNPLRTPTLFRSALGATSIGLGILLAPEIANAAAKDQAASRSLPWLSMGLGVLGMAAAKRSRKPLQLRLTPAMHPDWVKQARENMVLIPAGPAPVGPKGEMVEVPEYFIDKNLATIGEAERYQETFKKTPFGLFLEHPNRVDMPLIARGTHMRGLEIKAGDEADAQLRPLLPLIEEGINEYRSHPYPTELAPGLQVFADGASNLSYDPYRVLLWGLKELKIPHESRRVIPQKSWSDWIRQELSRSRNNTKDFISPRQPLIAVDWYESLAYLAASGKRLPDGAEWMKAAMGPRRADGGWNEYGTMSGRLIGPHGLYEAHNSVYTTLQSTAPVGRYPPNAYGAYDMAGNTWQWTMELYDPNGTARVLRGGSWGEDDAVDLRAACRLDSRPDVRSGHFGLRGVVLR